MNSWKMNLPVGSFQIGKILPFKRRLDRMHDHDIVHVVDPEVAISLVAHRPDGFLGAGLRFFAGQFTRYFKIMEMLEHGNHAFIKRIELGLALLNHRILGIIELVDRCSGEHRQGQADEKYSLVEILKLFIIANNQPLEEY
jgi:hypothetical protein